MTRKEIENTLKDLITQAQNVEACTEWGDRGAKREAQAELKDCNMMIMAEFDRLTARIAELEARNKQFCWNYPQVGELPNQWADIVIETASRAYYIGEYRPESGSEEFSFCVDGDKIENVKRWKYMD